MKNQTSTYSALNINFDYLFPFTYSANVLIPPSTYIFCDSHHRVLGFRGFNTHQIKKHQKSRREKIDFQHSTLSGIPLKWISSSLVVVDTFDVRIISDIWYFANDIKTEERERVIKQNSSSRRTDNVYISFSHQNWCSSFSQRIELSTGWRGERSAQIAEEKFISRNINKNDSHVRFYNLFHGAHTRMRNIWSRPKWERFWNQ